MMSHHPTRRQFVAAGASAGAVPAARAAARRQPNVLLINTDDQRFDTIRALGNPDIHTPTLDALARRGMSFRNYYCQGSMVGAVCLPSRTMLMTGRPVFRIPGPKDPPGNYPLLPKAFEKAGYATFHMGKRGNTYLPASEAFQKTLYSKPGLEDRASASEDDANAVIEFLRGHKGEQPFFVYLAPPVPHDPRVAPKKFMDMYDPARIPLPRNFLPKHPFDNGDMEVRDELLAPVPRTPDAMKRHIADYYAAITCLDYHVGRVVEELSKSGRLADTIIVYTSDQGLAVGGRHGLMGKQNLYEHFKAPLIFAGPGIPHGQSSELLYVHDLFPTLCGLAGAGVPEGVEGTSFAPLVRGRKQHVRDHLFALYKDCQRMVRDSRWKLIWYPKVQRFQMFDLEADSWEIDDLAGKPAHAAKLEALKKAMAAQQEKFEDRYAPRPA